MVMDGDSCPEGHGFESQHHTLDGHFFKHIYSKNWNVCSKDEIYEKGGRVWPIKTY